ncbi:hypothetical protein JVU11DRAFT_296 [Chiua virens]|nr:hypothetical protein JVU11DRAFT_296 [Chiua virens]
MATVNAGGDQVTVAHFYAAMYWGFVVSTSFVGISLVQGYLYFTKNNKDRWVIKALVVLLLFLDPATSILIAQTIYYYFILNFGVVEVLGVVPIPWVVEIGLSVFVTAMVQVFFASRVYLVNDTVVDQLPLGRTAPALVLGFALVAFVTGTVRTVFVGIWNIPTSSHVLFQASPRKLLTWDGEVIVSILDYRRSAAFRTLFTCTINRAILISVIQIGALVAYLSAKDYLYWMPFHLCKSKLYTNTLSMLNARLGGGPESPASSRPPWSLPVIQLTTKGSEGNVDNSMSTGEGISTSGGDVENLKEDPLKEVVGLKSHSSNVIVSAGPS